MFAVKKQDSETFSLVAFRPAFPLAFARCAALLLAVCLRLRLRLCLLSFLLLCLLMLSPRLFAHGSVVDGGDGCTIQFDFYSAHFAIFQPRTRQHREFCEDIPDVTESVFVMEYLHNSLREVPVDFRIIRNETSLGRFVKWSDLEVIDDLSPLTVFHQYFPPQPDGVLRVMHDFQEAGSYIGIVTVPHPNNHELIYHAVFPFRVGRTLTDYWAWSVPVLMLALLLYRQRNKRTPRRLPS